MSIVGARIGNDWQLQLRLVKCGIDELRRKKKEPRLGIMKQSRSGPLAEKDFAQLSIVPLHGTLEKGNAGSRQFAERLTRRIAGRQDGNKTISLEVHKREKYLREVTFHSEEERAFNCVVARRTNGITRNYVYAIDCIYKYATQRNVTQVGIQSGIQACP